MRLAFFVALQDVYMEVAMAIPSSSSSALSLVCQRGFEPSRVHQQVLAQAYSHVIAEPLGPRARTAQPKPDRSGETGSTTPVSPISFGGRCA